MSFYTIPNVERYVQLVRTFRVPIIVLYAIFAVGLFVYNPSQFITNEKLFWLNESKELIKTQAHALPTQHISRLTLHLPIVDDETLKKAKAIIKTLQHRDDITQVESLFSLTTIAKEGSPDSNLVHPVSLENLNAQQLKSYVHIINTRYIQTKNKGVDLHIYIYAQKPIIINSSAFDVPFTYSQPNNEANLYDFLLFGFIILLSIALMFRLIFKNYTALIGALAVIGISVLAVMHISFYLTGIHQIHIATALIVVAIALVDYLYFYYRWHVSQYNSNTNQALLKTLNRNLYPAFWTSVITFIGLGGVLFVDMAIAKTLSISLIAASLVAYILNITLLPALLSYFKVKKPKVPFGRMGHYFASQEVHYNPKFLSLFLIATLMVTLFSGYHLLFSNDKLFANAQKSGIIEAYIDIESFDETLIEKMNALQERLTQEFDDSIKIQSIASLTQELHSVNYPNTAMNAQYFLEAKMFLHMYDLLSINENKNMHLTITYDPSHIDKQDLVSSIKNLCAFELYIADVDTLVSQAKFDTSHLLSYSLMGALIAIGAVISFIFHSYKMAIVGFIVNATPIVWFVLFLHFLKLPISIEAMIAMTIALGLGSDATVHFAYKYWRARHLGRTQKHSLEVMFFYASVPVIIGSLVLIASFLLLSFSQVYTLQMIGIYGMALMFFSLLTDLFILPVFLLAFDPKKDTPTKD